MSLELALTLADNVHDWDVLTDWTYLGAGVSREAFLGPDGNVYKVGNDQCNRSEAEAAAWFKNKFGPTPGIFIPDFIYYPETIRVSRSVVQTVYIPADENQPWVHPMRRVFLHRLASCGMTDSHGGNVYTWRGMLTCCDWGYTDFFFGEEPRDSNE